MWTASILVGFQKGLSHRHQSQEVSIVVGWLYAISGFAVLMSFSILVFIFW